MNLHRRSDTPIPSLVNSVCVEELIDKSEENIQRVNSRLSSYISNPNDENIHNVRTAIRRLEASYICIPKNIRKRKVIRDYVTSSKELFKINSEVRDCDVILERLSEEMKLTHESLFCYFEGLLRCKRKSSLEKGISMALRLGKLSIPRLNKKSITERDLKNRYNKVIMKYSGRIEKNFPLVITDSRRIRELHEMRKDCKKLRYLLELLPSESNKTNKSEVSVAKLIKNLEKAQDLLGIIHDYDMTITYLRRHHKGTIVRRSSVQQVIERMIDQRDDKYKEFISQFKLSPNNNVSSLEYL